MKLPKEQQPPIGEISKNLDRLISQKLQRIFVVDIQNDCDCDVDFAYDSCMEESVFYISGEDIKESNNFNRIILPMKINFSDNDIWKLLEAASKKAKKYDESKKEIDFINMIYNPRSDGKKLYEVYVKTTNRDVHMKRDGEINYWIAADFVPENCVFFTPGPEFFGVISANVGKFGALCFAKNMLRVEL